MSNTKLIKTFNKIFYDNVINADKEIRDNLNDIIAFCKLVKAAKEANMKCIGVTTGAYSEKELQEQNPDLIVESIKNKNNIINFILDSNALTSFN